MIRRHSLPVRYSLYTYDAPDREGWAVGAGPNMSFKQRRAMCILYYPDGALFNGQLSALPKDMAERVGERASPCEIHTVCVYGGSHRESCVIALGEPLRCEEHLPLIWAPASGMQRLPPPCKIHTVCAWRILQEGSGACIPASL